MRTEELFEWLGASPALNGEKLNLRYLPAFRGWSMDVQAAGMKTDILGNRRQREEVSVTRRISVGGNADRLEAMRELETLKDWAAEHPPEGARVRCTAAPRFRSRGSSGTEDFVMTLEIRE